MSDPGGGFVTCSIHCANCFSVLASVSTLQRSVPRRKLYVEARDRGAVQNKVGSWFCDARCKMKFALTHETRTKEDLK